MNTGHYKALERVFEAEINLRLPFQSKAKVYRELEELHMVEPLESVFGHGRFAVTVRGWQLTHLGRLTYCIDCMSSDEVKTKGDEGG